MLKPNLNPNFYPADAFSRKLDLKICVGLRRKGLNHCKSYEYGMKLFISLILDCEIVLEFLEWGMSTVYIRVDRVLGAIFSENYRFDIAWRS